MTANAAAFLASMSDRLLLAALCSFIVAIAATPAVRDFARRRSMLDIPNDRSSHAIPVPRVGGTVIVVATLVGGAIATQYINWELGLLGITALGLAFAGLYDDVHALSPAQKYVPQVIAAIAAGIAIDPAFDVALPFIHFQISGILATALAAAWILTFINVLNFMDGVDGLAAGTGALISFGVLMLTTGAGAFMLLPLAGALLGFLCWNTSPASIFMGDAGSQFVGFVLAVGVLHWPGRHGDAVAIALIFSPLVFDTGFTLVRRLLQGKNIFQAHREHLYQRLVTLGYSHRAVANLYYLMGSVALMMTVWYLKSSDTMRALIIALVVVAFAAYARIVPALEAHRRATGRKTLPRTNDTSVLRRCRDLIRAGSGTP